MPILLMIFLLISGIAESAPSVSGVSGTVSHGGSITVSGSGFGTKSTAAPLIWDTGTAASLAAAGWSYGQPTLSDSAGNIHYSTAVNGVAMPHSHITKYTVGRHSIPGDNAYNGGNVIFGKILSSVSYAYISFYFQIDPNWISDYADNTPLDNNFKLFDFDGVNGWYVAPYWYDNYENDGPVNLNSPAHSMNDDSGLGTLQSPDNNGVNVTWGWPSANVTVGHWIKMEYELFATSSGTGFLRCYENGTLKMNYSGRTDNFPGTERNISIGGYARSRGNNNYRYYSDVYFDTSLQRVAICAGSTWASRGLCEVQIPSAWSASSITATVNQASFADSSNQYVYVVDSAGSANSSGYAVTFGTSGGDTTAPVITAFTMPATYNFLIVPVTTFSATDDTGVTGYCINESASAPTSGSCSGSGWVGSHQTSYTFASAGSKTLYAWAKDAAGNISSSSSAAITVTLVPSTVQGVTMIGATIK